MLHVAPAIKVPAQSKPVVFAFPRRAAYWAHLVLPSDLRGRIVDARVGLHTVVGLPDWVESRFARLERALELDAWRAQERLPVHPMFLVRPGLQVTVKLELDEPQAFVALFVFDELDEVVGG